ncbi:ClC family H(+)/Cl(-) exchange transporter [Bifidobacterium sp. ESL0763]|uniref:ClC family H(+)/Cl(-) exchange transporter n=1 Tax=Bifidobacterium sp. ESL0763 TaxID=2983227 RepID=UPI0023F9765A|nr:ClC family H(+)/Cl(-) exchange transporter [Bifidobacterium sp. ESL0763]MDF7663183.1 ClC family H(+)/Cl(-) exchange transporter [Bifidobacterium sp. ESL0763]
MATVGISRRSKWLVAARAVVCGLVAGILATCYRQGIEYGTRFARWMYAQIGADPWLIAPWALAAVLAGLFVAWLVRLEPMASGSGIPQVEGVVRLGLNMRAGVVLVVRFAGGLLCGMFGLSLGREGPSVQIGAAASQGAARAMRGFRKGSESDGAPKSRVSVIRRIRSMVSGHGESVGADADDGIGGKVGVKVSDAGSVDSDADGSLDARAAGGDVSHTYDVRGNDDGNEVGQSASQVGHKESVGASSNGRAGAGGPKTAETNVLVTAGAAAGLSAAFNAPLSGMMFALEEVHHSFSPAILLSSAAAAMGADIVSKYWFGLKPVLDFTRLAQLSLPQYWWMVPLGLVAGLVGVAMSKLLLASQTLFNKLPWWARPVISLAVALPVGVFLPQVLGGGESLIGFAERSGALGTSLAALLVLLAAKMLFTSTSFGSGVPGGIFMPILAVGTLAGSACGVALHAVEFNGGPLVPADVIPLFAVCAMAGTLTASVKAPMTSILLTVEMSGTLMHMLPVAACSFIALMVSDLCGADPIYDALLARYLSGHSKSTL